MNHAHLQTTTSLVVTTTKLLDGAFSSYHARTASLTTVGACTVVLRSNINTPFGLNIPLPTEQGLLRRERRRERPPSGSSNNKREGEVAAAQRSLL